MRQTIGGSWLIGLMVLFIFLFAGYIILTIDYNKSIRVKNEAISLVEKYEGLNEESITLVNNYLKGTGYMTLGKCGEQDGMYGSVDLESNELEETVKGQNYYYCVKKYKGANTSYYYQLTLFYRFVLPIIGDTTRFTIKGSTSNFQAKDDSKYAKTVDGSSGGVVNNGGYTPSSYYTVRFNVNGGSTIVPTQQVEPGGRATKPQDPVRDGYTFKGWKFSGNTWNFNTPITSNMVLIADWLKNTSSNNGNGEFNVPAGYTLAGVCSKSSISSIRDFIINCGQQYGYYTSKSLIISGFPVTDGEKTTLPNIKAFVCNDYNSFAGLNYTSSQINQCTSSIDSLYSSLPQKVIYKK